MNMHAPGQHIDEESRVDASLTWPQDTATSLLWFEIDDLVRHFDRHCHPMGIQRVTLELLAAALEHYPERTRLVRLCRLTNRLKQVSVADCSHAIAQLNAPSPHWRKAPRGLTELKRVVRQGLQHLHRLSSDVADSLRPAAAPEIQAGDILVSLGASWNRRHFPEALGQILRKRQVKLAFLLHDIIPLSHPHFAHHPSHVAHFRTWLKGMLSVSDLIFTSSHYSYKELVAYCDAAGWSVPDTAVVPFGSGFRSRHRAAPSLATSGAPYVLCVSTIEIRKNHALLIEVWRRLISRHGPDNVPTLLFIGEIGWGVKGLLSELRASDNLSGKVVIRSSVTDSALHDAYRGALFTVYPSLCEGWGLPISESLACGTACLASKATSLPEVGGELAAYFDPLDVDGTYDLIEKMIFDEAAREEAKLKIRDNYQYRNWSECLEIGRAHV